MTLESTLDRCQDGNDLFIHAPTISNLADKIDRLVNSTHKLDLELGQLLDKGQALALADTITKILTNHIQNRELLLTIAAEIGAAIESLLGATKANPKPT